MVRLPASVMVLARDPDVAMQLRRLAAVAGVEVAAASTDCRAAAVVVDVGMLVAGTFRPPAGKLLVVADSDPDPVVWRAAISAGASQVVTLPEQERDVLEWLTTVDPQRPLGRVVCCAPARGGAGASTLAAVLTMTAAAEASTLLVDADRRGGGMDLLLGIDEAPGPRWPDVLAARDVPWSDLPAVAAARVLSVAAARPVDVPDDQLVETVEAARVAHDVVVVDLADLDTARLFAASAPTAALVVPAEVRAVAAVAPMLRQLRDVLDLRVVLRQPGPGGLCRREVGDALGVPVDTWAWQRRLAAEVEAGRLAQSWRRWAAAAVATRVLRPRVAA